jgi:hypothetical protein
MEDTMLETVLACEMHQLPRRAHAFSRLSWMLLGLRYQQGRWRLVSLGLFGVIILKVFLADMARVSTPFRIVSFVVLGLRLISASYLYSRYRGYFLPAPPADTQL